MLFKITYKFNGTSVNSLVSADSDTEAIEKFKKRYKYGKLEVEDIKKADLEVELWKYVLSLEKIRDEILRLDNELEEGNPQKLINMGKYQALGLVIDGFKCTMGEDIGEDL